MEPTTQPETSNTTAKKSTPARRKPWLVPLAGGLTALALIVAGFMLWQSMNTIAQEETATASITITNSGFTPETIRVKKGQDVTWTNTGPEAHGIVSEKTDGTTPQTEEILEAGDTYSYVFEDTGTYTYRDQTNSSLTGVVVVE